MRQPASLWVAQLLISDATVAKISGLHGIDPWAVHDELVCRFGLDYTWDEHAERGFRAMVEIWVEGAPAIAVLYPIGDDVFHLGSAYRRRLR